ncbi:DUF4760 domain-containing protein [Labrenzia sp. OB1]|uniref:DUF4760 domain-containing protein n=1 Tax=Labrenzia sp. OB1 TaxID=1561204 RepID=UPI000A6CFC0F|nr:DUF4760 domain-containing protein [Labrenzia sp. OB1]
MFEWFEIGNFFPIDSVFKAIVFSTVISLIVGFTAALVTFFGIAINRATTIKRGTIELMLRAESDRELLDAHAKFNSLYNSNERSLKQYAHSDRHASNDCEQIRRSLNHLELIAIGIHNGTISAKIFEQWYKKGLVKQWDMAREFVFELRSQTGRETLYKNLEELSEIYSENNKKKENWLEKSKKKWF